MESKAFDYLKLKEALKDTITSGYLARHSKPDIYKNTLDCFSAVLDAKILGKNLNSWIDDVETNRLTQKTLQNEVGNIHTKVLATISGWEDLAVGKVLDLQNQERRIVVEMKNKHNTTKGNHKKDIYDDLASIIEKQPGYTGYYVEVLPKQGQRYDRPFCPTDNARSGEKRPRRDDIRIIDGYSFYALVTGKENALEYFYEIFPLIISDVLRDFDRDYTDVDLGDIKNMLFDAIYKGG